MSDLKLNVKPGSGLESRVEVLCFEEGQSS